MLTWGGVKFSGEILSLGPTDCTGLGVTSGRAPEKSSSKKQRLSVCGDSRPVRPYLKSQRGHCVMSVASQEVLESFCASSKTGGKDCCVLVEGK